MNIDTSIKNTLAATQPHHESARSEADSPWGSLNPADIPNLKYMALRPTDGRTKAVRQLDYKDNSHLYISGLTCACGNPDARWSGEGTYGFKPRCNDCMVKAFDSSYSHYSPQTQETVDLYRAHGITTYLAPVQLPPATGQWELNLVTDEQATKRTDRAILEDYINTAQDMEDLAYEDYIINLLAQHEADKETA